MKNDCAIAPRAEALFVCSADRAQHVSRGSEFCYSAYGAVVIHRPVSRPLFNAWAGDTRADSAEIRT